MPDHEIVGQPSTKISIWRHKIVSLFAKRFLWVGTAFILVGAGLLAFKLIHKTPHEKAAVITKQASQMVEKGKFNDAIQQLLAAYDTEPKLIIKAGIAYKIGVKYYQTGSSAEGKKWLEKASDDYKKAGDTASAESAKQQIITMEGAQKASNVNSDITDQSANKRGNIQDGNL